MAHRDWRESFEVHASNGTYAHPDSPAGGTGTGHARIPGGGHGRSLVSQMNRSDFRGGFSSSTIADKLIQLAPNVILQFTLRAGAMAQSGKYEDWAEHLGEISGNLNVVGTSLVLAGPVTYGTGPLAGEVVGVGAGLLDLSAAVLYIADGAVRRNRHSLLKGMMSLGYVFLDVATDNIGAVAVKRGAHGSMRYTFKSTGRYISYRVGAETIILRQYLLGEGADRGIEALAERYGKPRK